MPNEPVSAASPFDTVMDTVLERRPRTARAPAKPVPAVRAHRRPKQGELAFLAGVLALVAAVIAIANAGWYTAASRFGYWLGVAGGVGMLLLFLYPLRKRSRLFRNLGPTKVWFALHMLLGIAGPLLIVLHSTLKFGSINATVAFASMLLVACSGIIGRFLYGRIHHGLYGRRATLDEMRGKLGLDEGLVHSKLAFVPHVEQRLVEFARRAEAASGDGGLAHLRQLIPLGYQGARVRRECAAAVARALKKRALAEAWPRDKLDRRAGGRRVLIDHYVRAVQNVAHFGVYERLFSWWHVLHVPFLYLLVCSAIAHVVAVHIY